MRVEERMGVRMTARGVVLINYGTTDPPPLTGVVRLRAGRPASAGQWSLNCWPGPTGLLCTAERTSNEPRTPPCRSPPRCSHRLAPGCSVRHTPALVTEADAQLTGCLL